MRRVTHGAICGAVLISLPVVALACKSCSAIRQGNMLDVEAARERVR